MRIPETQIIVVRSSTLREPVSRFEVGAIVCQLLDIFSLQEIGLEIKLTHDLEIAQLNQSFLGVFAPTNILSFPETCSDSHLSGQMVLSIEALYRESFLYGQNMTKYLVRLLAHGVLHLSGYEHGEAMDRLTELAVSRIEP